MRSAFRCLVAGILIAQLSSVAWASDSSEIDYSEFWTVADVRGSVSAVVGANSWNQARDLVIGEKVGPHSLIDTGANGEVILVRGGDRITLYANTEIELPPLHRSLGITRIIQKAGEALFRVKTREKRNFEVKAPYLVAGVRGTAFGITTTGSASQLHVVEGAVAVGSGGTEGPDVDLVQALESTSANHNLDPQTRSAEFRAVREWDARTIRQAARIDSVAATGPSAIKDALGDQALSDLEDVTERLAARHASISEQAAAAPTPNNRAMAAMAAAGLEHVSETVAEIAEEAADSGQSGSQEADDQGEASPAANNRGLAAGNNVSSSADRANSGTTDPDSNDDDEDSSNGNSENNGNGNSGNNGNGNGNSGNNGNSGGSNNGNGNSGNSGSGGNGNSGNGNSDDSENSGNNGNGNGNNGNGNNGNGNNGNGNGNSENNGNGNSGNNGNGNGNSGNNGNGNGNND